MNEFWTWAFYISIEVNNKQFMINKIRKELTQSTLIYVCVLLQASIN